METNLPSPEELRRCAEILESVLKDRTALATMAVDDRVRLLMAAGRLSRPERLEIMKMSKIYRRIKNKKIRTSDRALRETTEIRRTRTLETYLAPPEQQGLPAAPELEVPGYCYVCKAEYRQLHFFYDSMCPPCAELNYKKRFQTARLDGRTAIVTGARVKIGFHIALKLLRAGARVIATTRFPNDAAIRYAGEADFCEWKDRLTIHGVDLRHSPSVERLAKHLACSLERLDIMINNACQTVRRPMDFYRHLEGPEQLSPAALPAGVGELVREHHDFKPADMPLLPGISADGCHGPETFPEGKLDVDRQQVDLRPVNSWRLTLSEVSTVELLEVHLVNAVAPFILCAKLKPLMVRSTGYDKHIVNVSAMEGKFARHTKTDKHPHTNMAKAALNMMTLTSAPEYARSRIYMNAVDTGWVTDEDPAHLAERKVLEHGFQPPLDIVDGAARVCDPIFSAEITGAPVYGKFLKDYAPTAW